MPLKNLRDIAHHIFGVEDAEKDGNFLTDEGYMHLFSSEAVDLLIKLVEEYKRSNRQKS